MEIEEFIDKLGLSQYEKQAYLALLRLGTSKSRQISKESKVSYGRIYEILDKLEERGLISIIPTEPKTFEAIDPKISFKLILKRKSLELMELEKEVNRIKPIKTLPKKIEDKTLVLQGKQKQRSMIVEMNERAKEEILVIPGVYEPNIASITTNRRALKRGVKIKRLLREVTSRNRDIVKENVKLGEKIRQKVLMGLRLIIIDKKEAMISIVDPKTNDRISIYTTNKDFASSMTSFFESLWNKSKEIKL